MTDDTFDGFVVLGNTFKSSILVRNTSRVPINSTAFPTFRVHGQNGFVESGTCSFLDTGTITGVSAANPAVVTSAAHGLTTGARVTITGVTGTGAITNANTTTTVTVISASTFSLDSTDTSGGTYSSGGTFNVTGAYRYSITVLGADGYEAGQNYDILFTYAISGTTYGQKHVFQVG